MAKFRNTTARQIACCLAVAIAVVGIPVLTQNWESLAYRDVTVICSATSEGVKYYALTAKRWRWLPGPPGSRTEISHARYNRALQAGARKGFASLATEKLEPTQTDTAPPLARLSRSASIVLITAAASVSVRSGVLPAANASTIWRSSPS